MSDTITIIILSSIFILLLRIIIKTEIIRRRIMNDMPDDEIAMDEIQEEEYNGKDLFIKEEERAIWENLTRGQKRKYLQKVEKEIKSGKFVRVEGGIITRAEAKEKGII